MPISDVTARNAKPKPKPYKLTNSEGLLLFVTPAGSKLWRMKYRIHGKEQLLSLGAYPADCASRCISHRLAFRWSGACEWRATRGTHTRPAPREVTALRAHRSGRRWLRRR